MKNEDIEKLADYCSKVYAFAPSYSSNDEKVREEGVQAGMLTGNGQIDQAGGNIWFELVPLELSNQTIRGELCNVWAAGAMTSDVPGEWCIISPATEPAEREDGDDYRPDGRCMGSVARPYRKLKPANGWLDDPESVVASSFLYNRSGIVVEMLAECGGVWSLGACAELTKEQVRRIVVEMYDKAEAKDREVALGWFWDMLKETASVEEAWQKVVACPNDRPTFGYFLSKVEREAGHALIHKYGRAKARAMLRGEEYTPRPPIKFDPTKTPASPTLEDDEFLAELERRLPSPGEERRESC